jgi:hypothetical protein
MSTGKSRATAVVPVSAISGGKPIALAAMRTQQQAVKMVPIAPATPTIRTVRITDLMCINMAMLGTLHYTFRNNVCCL